MTGISTIIEECFTAVFARNSNTFHIVVNISGFQVVIVADHKEEAILFVLSLHFFLGLTNLVIISGTFEFEAESGAFEMVIHNHNVRLSFLVTLFPRVNSF